jgi:hypothetical protein
MKKRASKGVGEPPMRREYDFRGGIRGKYAARFPQDSIAVVLEPDVARVFRDANSVNRALRALAELARQQAPPEGPSATAVGRSNRPMQRTGSAGR